jgi:hypothetical protein
VQGGRTVAIDIFNDRELVPKLVKARGSTNSSLYPRNVSGD